MNKMKMSPRFLKSDQVFEISVGPGFKFILPDNSRINLKNFVWSLQFISLRVSRLRLNSCQVMKIFSFVFNNSIVKKKSPLLYLFKLFWSSYWLSVLNRKQEIENWFSKNTNSFIHVLGNCFSPNTSDKATFIK